VSGGGGNLHPFLETKGTRRIINALTTPKRKSVESKKRRKVLRICVLEPWRPSKQKSMNKEEEEL